MYSDQDLIAQLNDPNQADADLVKRAYRYTQEAHKGHTRYSGEPYMVHTANVGYKLAAMGMGPRTICAGLLHDTIEDTPVTSEDIKNEFGEEVLFLVEGVTKLVLFVTTEPIDIMKVYVNYSWPLVRTYGF